MNTEEHQRFALMVETRLRCVFPALRCGVRPHVDFDGEQMTALLVFEVRAVDPPLLLAYTIIGTDMADGSTVETLVVHVGTLLSRWVPTMTR